MHQTIPANEWVSAFIESERAELPRHLPTYQCANVRIPIAPPLQSSGNLLEKLATSAAEFIRDFSPQLASARHMPSPKILDVPGDCTPRGIGDTAASTVWGSASALEINSILDKTSNTADGASTGSDEPEPETPTPFENMAALLRYPERAPRALDEGTPSLLATAAFHAASSLLLRRAASLLRAALLLAAEFRRAAALLGAWDRPRLQDSRFLAGDKGPAMLAGRTAGRPAADSHIKQRRAQRRNGDAGL
jgi:hypothetical protein